MKFESKFDLNDIVTTAKLRGTKREIYGDMLARIIAVQFDIDGRVSYVLRIYNGTALTFGENELTKLADEQET